MKWSEKYATGVEHLDQQHKRLFQMSEDYQHVLDEGRGERTFGLFLEQLHQYARVHFGLEEQCMYRYQCPVAEANKEAHGQFVKAILGFRVRYAASGFNVAEAQQLVQYVDHWLTDHIGRIDARLKPLVQKAEHS